MATTAIYTLPSDNVAPNATVTIQTGTDPGDPQYAPDVLVDLNPAKVAKILSTTGAWLFDFGSAQRVDLAAFIHGTFETTCTLHLQGNATDSWGAPSFDAEIDVQPWYGSGSSRWPRNHWVELTREDGYSAGGFRYWRLTCSGNSQNIHLGQVILSAAIHEMDPDLRWEYVESIRKRSIVNETAYGSKTIYARHTAQWYLEGDQRMTEALFRSQKEHFCNADGVGLPWILVPSEPEEDGSPAWQEHGECYFVRLVDDKFASNHTYFNVRDRKFMVEELSRGSEARHLMAVVYAEDFAAGNSLFSDTYSYNRPTDGDDPLYPFIRGAEGVYINGDGRLDANPIYTGEFETYQQAGIWIKGPGALNGGGPGGYAIDGFWNAAVGWVETLYYPTTDSLTEMNEEFVTAPLFFLNDPAAAFIYIGVEADLDDAFLIVHHRNDGSHDNTVTITGATMPIAGEPYLVRMEWQCGTVDPDTFEAAPDGFVRLYINGVLEYEATNISLVLTTTTDPPNLVDSATFGYFGLFGPLDSFAINDAAFPSSPSIQFRSGGTEVPLAWMEITFREIP